MLFQWYLFFFLILLYALARVANQRYEINQYGEYEGRYKWFTALAIIAVLTVVAAMRHERFIDTMAYIKNFLNADPSRDNIMRILNGNGKDKAFYILTCMLRGLLGTHYRVYLGIIAGFCLLCLFSVYRRHSSSLFMTTFLFIASGEYVMWTHNGIRQFIAVSMVFAATDLLLRRKYAAYIAVILIFGILPQAVVADIAEYDALETNENRSGMFYAARTFAFKLGQSIAMLLVIMVLTTSVDVLNDLLLSFMENSQYSNDIDAVIATGGTNAFRVLVFAIPPVVAFFFRKQIARLNIPIINLSVNMSIVSIGIYIISMFTSGIYIGRLPVYFSLYNYILLPWMIDRFFEKYTAKFIHLCMICSYMIYYYYQMHIVWAEVTAL